VVAYFLGGVDEVSQIPVSVFPESGFPALEIRYPGTFPVRLSEISDYFVVGKAQSRSGVLLRVLRQAAVPASEVASGVDNYGIYQRPFGAEIVHYPPFGVSAELNKSHGMPMCHIVNK
jgi:hypothetical protein